MPSLPHGSPPAYRLHRATGQAVVTLNGRDVYLGKHGTAASRAAYDRITGEWLTNGRQFRADATLTITELAAAFWTHAQAYYAKPIIGADGQPSIDANGQPLTAPAGELENFRLILGKQCPLRRLYGITPAAEFGPLKLQAVRAELIKAGLCRSNLNRQVGRIKSIFKWAVAQELVPASVHHGLSSVAGIRKGRHGVRESQRVRPARDELVDAALTHLSPTIAAMVRLQRLTGMRSGEVCIMRGRDIETAGKVWVYRPASHKTEHHDIRREILIGPQAIEIVRPFLKHDVDAYLFSPSEAERDRRLEQRQQRKTKVQPSQVKRAERAARRQRRRPSVTIMIPLHIVGRSPARARQRSPCPRICSTTAAIRLSDATPSESSAGSGVRRTRGTPTSCATRRRHVYAGSSDWRPPASFSGINPRR